MAQRAKELAVFAGQGNGVIGLHDAPEWTALDADVFPGVVGQETALADRMLAVAVGERHHGH